MGIVSGVADTTAEKPIQGKYAADLISGDSLQLEIVKGVQLDLVYCQPGSFLMGSPSTEKGRDDNEIQHQVTLTADYYLGKYEVTQQQYLAVMGVNPSYFKDGGNYPVDSVSIADAKAFCDRLNALGVAPAGYQFTLPTEAQWEYACRAGVPSALYSGKELKREWDRDSNMDELAWYAFTSGDRSHEVGCSELKPNVWGFYDMYGNVGEWVSDWYGDYPEGAVTDPTGPKNGTLNIYRGGTMSSTPDKCRSAARTNCNLNAEQPKKYHGFRVALVSLNIEVPRIIWGPYSPIDYGTALGNAHLNALAFAPDFSVCEGTFTYNPPAGTILNAGTNTLWTTFFPSDTEHYVTVSNSVALVVNKVTPVLKWSKPAPIPSGTPLSERQLCAKTSFNGENVAGTYTYTPSLGEQLTVGDHTLSVNFTPIDNKNFNSVTKSVVLHIDEVSIGKTTPTIDWGTPDPIEYGTKIDEKQCNAVAKDNNGAEVPGKYDYSIAAGTILTAGKTEMTVTFTPENTSNYSSAVASVWITVTKATPSITWVPGTLSYGQALSEVQLNATANVEGKFTYDPAKGTVLDAGTHTLTVTFTPTDNENYNQATKTVSLLVISSEIMTISLANDVSLEMVHCLPGTFMMGSPEGELGRGNDENQYEVTLDDDFYIGRYLVTQTQYEKIIGRNPSLFKTSGDLPVENISWFDAEEFCHQLNSMNIAPVGYRFALPTEAQWEYACRAGTTTALNDGKELSSTTFCEEADEVAWYSANSANKTHEVGQKAPNAWGIYDMYGNVFEWCADWYGQYPTEPVINPEGPQNGTARVIRGGNYTLTASWLRSAKRYSSDPNTYKCRGIRVAMVKAEASLTPTLFWKNPEDITYGTPLSEVQLNATANVEGEFVYDVAAGTILDAGIHTLNVVFTPYDSIYASVATTTTLVVNKAKTTIKALEQCFVCGVPIILDQSKYEVIGDTPVGQPKLTENITRNPDIGTYKNAIIVSNGTIDTNNYDLTFISGDITVGLVVRSINVINDTANVSLSIQPPPSMGYYLMEESLPAGVEYTVSDISDNGFYNEEKHTIRWVSINTAARTVSYTLTIQSQHCHETLTVNGQTIFSTEVYEVVGDKEMKFSCLVTTHPADTDSDYSISGLELSLYMNAWQMGTPWPVAPAAIPMNYLVSAIDIWLRGGDYVLNESETAPSCWTSPVAVAVATSDSTAKEAQAQRTILVHGNVASVTLLVNPDRADYCLVEERLSSAKGLKVSNISDGGNYIAEQNIIHWIFLDGNRRVLTYNLSADENVTLTGTAQLGQINETISGATVVAFDGISDFGAGADSTIQYTIQNGKLVLTFDGALEESEDTVNWRPSSVTSGSTIDMSSDDRKFFRIVK